MITVVMTCLLAGGVYWASTRETTVVYFIEGKSLISWCGDENHDPEAQGNVFRTGGCLEVHFKGSKVLYTHATCETCRRAQQLTGH